MELKANFTIGYYLSASKLEKMKWNQLVELAKTKYNIKCVPIDLDMKEYPAVCPYDVIIHKFTDELSDMQHHSGTIEKIERLLKQYPKLVQVDALEYQKAVLDRLTLSYLLDKLNELPKDLNIRCPSFVVIENEQTDYTPLISKLRFPVVCKTIQACGSEESHQMAICFTEKHLHQFKAPMLVQEYINHNAIIYKVFVIGNYINVVHRKSLRNFEVSQEKEPRFFDSQKPLPTTLLPEKEYTSDMVQIPPLTTLTNVSKYIEKELGLTLFGFDVITDTTAPYQHAIVDLNYFPGYIGITDFFQILLSHILSVYLSKQQ